MKTSDAATVLLDALDLSAIQDERARHAIRLLLNLVEEVKQENRSLREDNQRLRDENNRLKGEQGKPKVKANTRTPPAPDYSSERERRQPQERGKRSKRAPVPIDREQVLTVDPATLPSDAEFKGYEEVVVQDVVIRTDNVLFRKQKFYSATERRTYLADLPAGYSGEFGPGIHALVLVFYFACQMTEPKILAFLHHVGIQISAGEVSNLVIKGHAPFHQEKDAAFEAGLRSSPWQQTDDTATRVNGQTHHCHIVDNPLHTTYLTLPGKDRLSVIDALRNGQPRVFRYTDDAEAWLEAAKVSLVTRQTLTRLPRDQDLDAATLTQWLDTHLPGLGMQTRKVVVDALAVAAYQAQVEWPVVRLLVCDDAPQFTLITDELGLCWVHEGRHYKKLTPTVPLHRQLLERFLRDFWTFYDELLAYREQPTLEERARLEGRFETVFTTTTGYWALDERIRKTWSKKESLLLVLAHPEIPLHNNASELGARQRVRKRAISFGPRTAEGARAWDTFMSLAATSRKLGVNFLHYLHDRITGANQIPSLATIIDERAHELDLGASWTPA
ncbi:MAG: transposase [Armatimonadota bacterium]|nr:transposase [Armatimonadota bacterium]